MKKLLTECTALEKSQNGRKLSAVLHQIYELRKVPKNHISESDKAIVDELWVAYFKACK